MNTSASRRTLQSSRSLQNTTSFFSKSMPLQFCFTRGKRITTILEDLSVRKNNRGLDFKSFLG